MLGLNTLEGNRKNIFHIHEEINCLHHDSELFRILYDKSDKMELNLSILKERNFEQHVLHRHHWWIYGALGHPRSNFCHFHAFFGGYLNLRFLN